MLPLEFESSPLTEFTEEPNPAAIKINYKNVDY